MMVREKGELHRLKEGLPSCVDHPTWPLRQGLLQFQLAGYTGYLLN